MTDTTTDIRITQVGTVMVPVTDQDKAVEFFVDKLGFEVRQDTPYGEGDRWVEVAPPGSATSISLVNPGDREPTGVWTRVAFSSEDIDADHANLRARGVDTDDEVMRMPAPVPPMFFFNDPDGNRFLLVG